MFIGSSWISVLAPNKVFSHFFEGEQEWISPTAPLFYPLLHVPLFYLLLPMPLFYKVDNHSAIYDPKVSWDSCFNLINENHH